MNIKELLKEATKDTLSDENLQKLEEAINNKVKEKSETEYGLKLEAALAKQDTDYASKLETLLEQIDEDHTNKMKKLVEAIDRNHAGKLKQIIEKYKTQYSEEISTFKENLVKKIDKYFDMVVEQELPKKELRQACENTKYKRLVEQIANTIGISKIQENTTFKKGILDAKNTIDTLTEQVNELKKQNQKLVTESLYSKRDKLLTEKTQGLPKIKKDYIFKVLGNKSLEHINENFDYVLELYDNDDVVKTSKIKDEATKRTKVISENIDRVEQSNNEVINEQSEVDFYMDELSKI